MDPQNVAQHSYGNDADSILHAFEIAFEHAIRDVVSRKLAERMADIEKYLDSVNLQTVISDILASEFTRQFVAGRLLGGGGGTSSDVAGGPLSHPRSTQGTSVTTAAYPVVLKIL
jgi:hypothetical protein